MLTQAKPSIVQIRRVKEGLLVLMKTVYVTVTQLSDTCFPFTEQQSHSETMTAFQTAPYWTYSALLGCKRLLFLMHLKGCTFSWIIGRGMPIHYDNTSQYKGVTCPFSRLYNGINTNLVYIIMRI